MSSKKIVIIADNDVFLSNIYRVKFEMAGFEAYYATTVREVVALSKKYRPDVIVSDIEVGGLGGFELIERLKKVGKVKIENICFVFLTRYSMYDDVESAKKQGVKECWVKTQMTFDDVIGRVGKILDGMSDAGKTV